jgi:predicted RNA binding protein YcfA (HicA-like mRNA interferase family)
LESALARNGHGPLDRDELILGGGWDTAAWYQSIHIYGSEFGIFIKDDAVRTTALRIASFHHGSFGVTRMNELGKAFLRAATCVYFLHEHFHHKVESLGFRLEVVTRRPVYVPYFRGVYSLALGTDHVLEEALANADAFARISSRPYRDWIPASVIEATRSYLNARFPFDPPGYRMACKYLARNSFEAGRNLLQSQVCEVSQSPLHAGEDWGCAPRMIQSLFSVESEIWTVVTAGRASILPTRSGMHVRTASTDEMVRLLRSKGFRFVDGGKGSHIKLTKAGSKPAVLPGNRENLSPGVVRVLLRLLGDFELADLRGLLRDA